jgi:pyruvate ferredoxin oxidoreductase gamma subunit
VHLGRIPARGLQAINIRAKVYPPNVVIVLASGLLELLDPTEGMGEGGILILNTKKKAQDVVNVEGRSIRVATVDAGKIAIEELGRPIVNTTMLGAFVKAAGILDIADIREPLLERFGTKLGERNLKAMERAFQEVTIV